MKPAHWLPGFDDRTQAALDFIDAEIAAGRLAFGYPEIAAHLTETLGVEHTLGDVAGMLNRHAARETREWLRAREVEMAA
jgi:hypothetical protein